MLCSVFIYFISVLDILLTLTLHRKVVRLPHRRKIHTERKKESRECLSFLSSDTESINFDRHLRCGGWLNFEFS